MTYFKKYHRRNSSTNSWHYMHKTPWVIFKSLPLSSCIKLFNNFNMLFFLIKIPGQTVLIPRGSSTIFPTSSLEILRIGGEQHNQSRTVSSLLLLTSGGLVVYLLYKSCTSDENSEDADHVRGIRPPRPKWSAQSWIKWLLFGDTPDLRGQYFGPSSRHHHHKPPEAASAIQRSSVGSSSSGHNSNIGRWCHFHVFLCKVAA